MEMFPPSYAIKKFSDEKDPIIELYGTISRTNIGDCEKGYTYRRENNDPRNEQNASISYHPSLKIDQVMWINNAKIYDL